jgi:hypothetical protein
MSFSVRRSGHLGLLALLLAAALSFWLAPAPQGQPDVEYWGHYARVGPGLGFIVNHDSYGYLEVAQEPARLLRPQEVRQSRPLYALLGAAVGYPLTAALGLAGRLGLAPRWLPDERRFYGFYSGYVLLNGLTLLASLLLFRKLFEQLAVGRGQPWQFYALAWVLVANPITKVFFWTAHQQLLAFLVPLFCLWLALAVGQRTWKGWPMAGLAFGLGWLPLVYGSFALAWPALAYGAWRARPASRRGWGLAGQLLLSAALFALPTLLWIALLRAVGTTYYNHEAVRYHQVVWLLDVAAQPGLARAVADKLVNYLASLHLMSLWLLGAAGLLLATWWQRRHVFTPLLPVPTAAALGWVAGCFIVFFALLGYYPERLAYTLLPLVLCLLAGLLPHWPARYARPVALCTAAGWHLYVLLSYGPFS